VVSVSGTALALFNAYMTARKRTKLSYFLHLMSITSLAIPGLVLGLSYVMFFKRSFIYGTFAILFLVNSMHFFSSPYLMAYNTFGKINENLEDVGSTLGIGRWKIVRDVLIPQSTGTILEMMSYFFVNSMMTISAVSFLANVGDKPIALMITQFEGQMQLECAAFVSLVILLVNVAMKYGVFLIRRRTDSQ
jgi:iron(III) transport system permease protein